MNHLEDIKLKIEKEKQKIKNEFQEEMDTFSWVNTYGSIDAFLKEALNHSKSSIFLTLRVNHTDMPFPIFKEKMEFFLERCQKIYKTSKKNKLFENSFNELERMARVLSFLPRMSEVLERCSDEVNILIKIYNGEEPSLEELNEAYKKTEKQENENLKKYCAYIHYLGFSSYEVYKQFVELLKTLPSFETIVLSLFNLSLIYGRVDNSISPSISDDENTQNFIKKINDYSNQLRKKYHKRQAEIKSEEKRLSYLEKYFSFLDLKEYITLNSQLSNYLMEDDLSVTILEFILKHNLTFDQELEEKYKKEKQNSYESLLLLFQKYNYDIRFLDRKTIKQLVEKKDIEEIEEVLSFLYTYDYKIDESFSFYLFNASQIKISYLRECINHHQITFSYLLNHPFIIGEKFDDFKNNMDLLTQIVPNKKLQNSSLFLSDFSLLKMLLHLSKQYHIDLENVSLQFLNHKNAFKNLDQWIELGEKDFILNHMQYLTEDTLPLKIKLAKKLKLESILDGKIQKNLDSKLGYVKEDDIYKALLLKEEKENDFELFIQTSPSFYVTELENKMKEYEKDEYTYEYMEIYISKNRFLRNVSSLVSHLNEENESDILYESLITGSLYNEEEKEKIKSLVSHLSIYKPFSKTLT